MNVLLHSRLFADRLLANHKGLYAERRWLTAQQIPSNGVSTKAG
jgi:hypothetical protein